jgi:hypothetical protein
MIEFGDRTEPEGLAFLAHLSGRSVRISRFESLLPSATAGVLTALQIGASR